MGLNPLVRSHSLSNTGSLFKEDSYRSFVFQNAKIPLNYVGLREGEKKRGKTKQCR